MLPYKHPLPNASLPSESDSRSIDVCFSRGSVLVGPRSFHSCTSVGS